LEDERTVDTGGRGRALPPGVVTAAGRTEQSVDDYTVYWIAGKHPSRYVCGWIASWTIENKFRRNRSTVIGVGYDCAKRVRGEVSDLPILG